MEVSTELPVRSEAETATESLRTRFRQGFTAMIPLWPGVIPFSFAFAILAHSTGFSMLETQMLSMFVFAGSAQLAIVGLYATGASALLIIVTATILNLRHVLYGLSLNPHLAGERRIPKSVLAFFLTDESYGLTIRELTRNRSGAAFFLGSGISLYAIFSISTLAGLLFGALLPDPEKIGMSFIFPLMFMALLLPLVRSRRAIVVALTSAVVMLGMLEFASSGVAFLVAVVSAATVGALLDARANTRWRQRGAA